MSNLKQEKTNQTVENETVNADVLSESVRLGFKTGLLISTIYSIAGIILFFVISITDDLRFSRFNFTDLPKLLHPINSLALIVVIIAISPSTLIGGWTGMIIGKVATSSFARKIPNRVFTLISMVICGLTAILIHILFQIKIVLPFESPATYMSFGIFGTYPFLFGIPTIIYIIAGGWFGRTIYSRFLIS